MLLLFKKYILTLLKKGELSYNKGNSKYAKYGVVYELTSFNEGLVPKVYHSFSANIGTISTFIEYYFLTKKPDKQLSEYVTTTARMDGLLNISYDDFMKVTIRQPQQDEQEHVSKLFRAIDDRIKIYENYLNKITNYKQAMLQKMFPKEGETVPEVRFDSFVDEWEEHNIGRLMEVTSVKRIHQSEWTNEGVRFLRARDIVAASKNEEPSEYLYISKNKYDEYTKLTGKVQLNDLLVTGVGTIGVSMLITNNKPLYFKDGNIIWFKNNGTIDG